MILVKRENRYVRIEIENNEAVGFLKNLNALFYDRNHVLTDNSHTPNHCGGLVCGNGH